MKLSVRLGTPADWEAIQKLHVEQQQKQGTNYELPYIFGKQFPGVLVAVDEQDIPRGVMYCEAVAEMRGIGCDPRATAVLQRESSGLAYLLKLQGFRWLECFVPQSLKQKIAKPLKRAGFTCVDDQLAHFTKDLRGDK